MRNEKGKERFKIADQKELNHHEFLWKNALEKQKNEGLLRQLHHEDSPEKDEIFLDFTTNDYLSLSGHPRVIEGAINALQEYGAGKCSSRLIGGGYHLLDQFEKEIADWYGKESALIFPSGYQANISLLSALLKPSSLVIADKYIHRSLIDGIKLSGAKMIRYPHGNLEAMEALLQKNHRQFSEIICVTESVFSMHGTMIDLDAFCRIATRFGALSCIDDAHGFGVLKENEKSRLASSDIVITTLSKGLGVQGGAVIGSKRLIHYLVNFATGFIYTTSLSPAIVGGAIAALRLLPDLSKDRLHLRSLCDSFASRLKNIGLSTHPSMSQIQPVYVGQVDRAQQFQKLLKEKMISVVAIRSPTVPLNQSLLRFSLSTRHSESSLNFLFCELQRIVCQR